MKCENIQELLPFIDDGSIAQDIVEKIKIHLEECAGCRKQYNEIKTVVNMVSSVLNQYELPRNQELLLAVHSKIAAENRKRKNYRWMLPAAAVVIFTISLSLYSVLTQRVTVPAPEQIVLSRSDDEFYDYIVEEYFDTYDLIELVDEEELVDEDVFDDILYQFDYIDVTIDDIIESIDENEMYNFFNEIRGEEK